MEDYFRKERQLMKIFVIGLLPIMVLLSIQFLVVAEESDGSVRTEEIQKENSENYLQKIWKYDLSSQYLFSASGTASHYAHRFHNRRTASGERFNMFDFTAAHRRLPFGTIIKVTNQANGNSVLLRINDRGPHIKKRIVDLSYAAAKEIEGMGLPQVKIEGFLRGKHNIGLNHNEEYFFAYSLIHSPVCVPRSITNVIDSTTNFQEAVEMLKARLERPSQSNTFLLVESDADPKSSNYYYIGTIGKPKTKPEDLTKL